MVEPAPLWSVLALPVVLAVLATGAAALDAVLAARAAGRPAPLRGGHRDPVRLVVGAAVWSVGSRGLDAAR